MTPYRASMFLLPVDTSPPWWQRVWFRIARDDATQRWQWARQTIGGRWTREFCVVGVFESEWVHADRCPGDLMARHARGELSEMFGVCTHSRCCCEVWP